MIWKIARKEFLLNLMTFKFAAATSVCMVLTAVFTPILAKDYQQRLNAYRENVTRNEAEMGKIKVYEHLKPTVFRPPAALSIFSQGLEKQFGNSVKVVYNEVPEISVAAANHYLSIFPVFDASLLFKIVMSVLALLVAYDAVSGEREQGTLRLMLSGTTARYQVLLGKLLAGLMVVAVPTAVTFIVGLLILLSFPMVNLAGSDWIRIGFMFLASLLFVGTMYNLGLLFSSVAGRSATSLVLGLFFWVLFVLVIPNATIYVATQLRQLAREDQLNDQIAALMREREQEFKEQYTLLGRGVSSGSSSTSDVTDAFGRFYMRSCNKALMERNLIRYGIGAPLEIKYAGKQWEVKYNGYLRGLFEQRRLAGHLARISPISLYENVMSALAGTDMAGFQQFIDGVRAYRNDVVEYLRAKTNNFSLPCFFTPCTEEEMVTRPHTDNAPALEVSDAPQFRYTRHTTEDLRRALPDLGLLAAVNVVLLALAFVAFARYDVR